jgi:hypothetical protein
VSLPGREKFLKFSLVPSIAIMLALYLKQIMKTIGYVRVSTDGQAQDGVSLDAQEAKIRAWAELNNGGR